MQWSKVLVLAVTLVLGVRGEAASTFWPQTYWHSNMTKMALLAEKYESAFDHAVRALETDPMKPELHLNLGNALEGLGAFSKAKDAYSVAERLSNDPAIQFQSRFNQAQVLAKDKKIEEALSLYQKALEIDPTSKEVKTNIELLMASSGGKGGEGEPKEQQEGGEGDSKEPKEPKKFAENPNQQPKQPQNLSPADVKKILEELKQQEQRIRGDYYKQGQRENKQKSDDGKREKDW
jgi:Ca-activated chloride channel family protein